MEIFKKYRNKLEELKVIFYLILERYKKTYPLKVAYPSEENKMLYAESKAQMDNVYKDLVFLDNKINSSIDNISQEMHRKDKIISKLKTRYGKDKNNLTKLRGSNLASYPLKGAYEQKRIYSYILLIYYLLGGVGLLYLIWLGSKSLHTGTLIPIPSKIMKIVSIAIAIVSTLIINYYY